MIMGYISQDLFVKESISTAQRCVELQKLLTVQNDLWQRAKDSRGAEAATVDVQGTVSDDLLQRFVSFSLGDSAHCREWRSQDGTVLDLLRRLSYSRAGPKDGPAITQGSLSGPERKKENVIENHVLMLDFDTGASVDSVLDWLKRQGLFAAIWTTHSHGKTATEISERALSRYRQRQGCDKLADNKACISFLREEKSYTEQLLESLEDIEHVMTESGAVYRCHHAPTDRFRVLFVLKTPFKFFKHAEADHSARCNEWSQRYKQFASDHNCAVDQKCCDPARLMYLPSAPARRADNTNLIDPQLWIVGGDCLDLEALELKATSATSTTGRRGTYSGSSSPRTGDYAFQTPNLLRFVSKAHHAFEAADWLEAMDDLAIVSKRDGKLTFACPNEENHSNPNNPGDPGFFASNASDSPTNSFVMYCQHQTCAKMSATGSEDRQDRAFYLDLACRKYGVEDAFDLLEYCPSLSEDDRAQVREQLRDRAIDEQGFVLAAQGNRKSCAENWFRALELLKVELSYDEMSGRCFVAGLDAQGYGPELDDKALCELRISVERNFGIRVTKDNTADWSLNLAYKNRSHPIRSYLDEVQPHWDGKSRLESWLLDYMAAEDTALNREFGKLFLIAAVRRIRQPGCKFDTMLVLESGQGAGKSSAVQILAGGSEYFTDALPLGASSQETIELTRGAWIVECAELNGISRREIELIKANLSRQTDRARAAYGRIVENVPRQWVMIGTTNEDKYLKDETGNRRFWPVEVAVTKEIDLEGLRRDRDQLFAEAANLEAAGEELTLPKDLWLSAHAAQDERKHENQFVGRLEPELAKFKSGIVHPTEIYVFLGLPSELHQSQAERVAKAMEELGWAKKQKKRDGKNQRLFVKDNGNGELVEIIASYDNDRRRYFLCSPLKKDVYASLQATDADL